MLCHVLSSGVFHAQSMCSPFSGWDSDMASLLLLVYLLPPPPSGKNGAVKISIREAVDRVVKFHRVIVS